MTKAAIPLPPDGQDFAELMAVESIDENTFKSVSKQCPGPPRVINGTLHISTYGGHIYAQSAWAAAQTVGDGFVIHNTSGYFISAGFSAFPFVYKVLRIRDGKSFLTRSITATQPSSPFPHTICFTALISFKVPEPPSSAQPSYQDASHPPPLAHFADILRATHPRDLPVKKYDDLAAVILDASSELHRSPSMPGIWWAQLPYANRDARGDPDTGHWDPRPAARRAANVYTVNGNVALSGKSRSVNLSICVHLFASDRETIFTVARQLGVHGRTVTPGAVVSSVSHSVVLHEVEDGVVFPDSVFADGRRKEEERWFCQEVWTDRWADGRVVVHGRVYDVDTGAHVASTMQEGILKPDLKDDQKEVEKVENALLMGAVPKKLRTSAKM